MRKKGSLLVISGFSGVGKGTAAKRLVEKYGYSPVSFGNDQKAKNRRSGRPGIFFQDGS